MTPSLLVILEVYHTRVGANAEVAWSCWLMRDVEVKRMMFDFRRERGIGSCDEEGKDDREQIAQMWLFWLSTLDLVGTRFVSLLDFATITSENSSRCALSSLVLDPSFILLSCPLTCIISMPEFFRH